MEPDIAEQGRDRPGGLAPDVHEQPEEHSGGSRNDRLVSWFRRWRKPIRHWLSSRSSVPAADIDDLAQEVFLRLLRYSDDIAIDNPQGYLFRITANVANEWHQRARHRGPHEQTWLEDLQIEPRDEPENLVSRTLVHEKVRAAMHGLPQRQRDILLLHVNEGLTYWQIAQRLGLSHRVVLRDLTRAYSKLRSQLNVEDFAPRDQA